tara:strand:- start:2818 stop:3012 length:195 start_codon:yes stop_codon:yes gene_type:complete
MAKKVAKKEAKKEVVAEEPVVEEPQPEPRELPKVVGEETSETKMVGGQLMRIVKTPLGTTYEPL